MDYKGKVTCSHIVGDPEVRYLQKDCPRCMGTGEYGGVDIQSDITTISGYTQLEQDIKKILIERRRETGYGFDYELLRSIIDVDVVPIIKREIVRCMSYLRGVQQEEVARGSSYNPKELLSNIKQLDVAQSSVEPRRVDVRLIINTEAGTVSEISLFLRR